MESSVYEMSAQKYADYRKDFNDHWKESFDKPVHPSYVSFYNRIYSQVQGLVQNTLKGSSIELQERASKAYSFRFKEATTVKDLLATDIFCNKTVTMDIPVELVTSEMAENSGSNFNFLLSSYHITLHWPQATEFLFLHEMIVAYLGNLIQHDGELPARGLIPIEAKSYWTIPAYIVRELAIYLKRSEAEVVALHFQSNEEVKNALPKNIQDLLLISAHLTFYVDLLLPVRNPAGMLTLIYTCFFYKSLEKLTKNPQLQLHKDAGKLTDQILFPFLVDVGGAQTFRPPTEPILQNMFLKFADLLWV